jgi:hypothetical protein
MHIVLTVEDISKLSHSARAGCCPSLSKAHVDTREYPAGFDSSRFEGEPYPGQIESFMEGCSEKTVAGLRVIAEHGPVIHAKLLNDVGIENYGSFQGGVTKRTRTITGDSEACLFAFDDWSEAEEGVGHFAVTKNTFRSLRIYFELD